MATGDAPITLTISAAGIDRVERALRQGHGRLAEAFREIGEVILDFWAGEFDKQNWPDLELDTKRKKAKAGYSVYPMMVASRQIRNVLDKSIKNAPGRVFVVTGKSVTVGYGGTANYQPQNEYTRSVGRIADLAWWHQTGNYRGGKRRVLTPNLPSNLNRTFQRIINQAVRDIFEGE